jgi:hypothetical protein
MWNDELLLTGRVELGNEMSINQLDNEWKKKIGATHEKCVKKYDTNVQVQGLPGRMSGYWRDDIVKGHKTGPHRTSIDAIKEYEELGGFKEKWGVEEVKYDLEVIASKDSSFSFTYPFFDDDTNINKEKRPYPFESS